MPSSVGPYQTRGSNLVFNYDVGDVANSYIGEPTTNLVDPRWESAWSIDGSGQGSVGTRTMLSQFHCKIVDIASNTRQYAWVYGLTGNTIYTFSVKFKKIGGSPTLRFQIQPYNGGSYILTYFPTTAQIGLADIDGWQTAKYTITTPANTDRVLWFMQDGDDYTTYTHSFELKDVQCEQKSHPTPFVYGTRSNTQGLLDISGYKKSIPLNTSYDANAIMYFDGTDDYISIPNTTSFGTFTAEVVIKPTAYPGNAASAISTEYPGSNSTVNFTLGFDGSTFMGGFYNGSSGGWHQIFTSLPTLNVYSHYVLTFNGAQMIMYKNGVSVGTFTTNDIAAGGNPIRIGRRWDLGDYFPGRIDVAKVYNRALSQSEVTTNYNSYKKRFNLA